MSSEERKRGEIAAGLSLTLSMAVTPCYYEQIILEQYVDGLITMDTAMLMLKEYNQLAMTYAFLPPSLLFLSQERTVDKIA